MSGSVLPPDAPLSGPPDTALRNGDGVMPRFIGWIGHELLSERDRWILCTIVAGGIRQAGQG